MNYRDHVRVLLRSWPIVLLTAAMGAILSALPSLSSTAQFEATAVLLVVGEPRESPLEDNFEVAGLSETVLRSLEVLGSGQSLKETVAETLGTTTAEVNYTVLWVEGSQLIEISARGDTAEIAESTTSEVANGIVTLVDRMPAWAESGVDIQVAERGVAAREPDSGANVKDALVGAFLGLGLGVALAYVRAAMDPLIRSIEEVRSLQPDATIAVATEAGAKKDPSLETLLMSWIVNEPATISLLGVGSDTAAAKVARQFGDHFARVGLATTIATAAYAGDQQVVRMSVSNPIDPAKDTNATFGTRSWAESARELAADVERIGEEGAGLVFLAGGDVLVPSPVTLAAASLESLHLVVKTNETTKKNLDDAIGMLSALGATPRAIIVV